MTGRRRRWIVLGVVLVAAAGLWLSAAVWLPAVGCWLDASQAPVRCDYVMVLGGGPDIRPFAAAAIYRAGLARKVIISDTNAGEGEKEDSRPSEVELTRQVLLRRQVPAADILVVGPRNASTYDEARRLADFLQTRPARRVLIVTHDFHTRRAAWIFRQCLAGQPVQVAVVGVPNERFQLATWWRNETGFVTVLGENVKLLAYLARYGNRRVWLPLVLLGAVILAIVLWRRMRRGLGGTQRLILATSSRRAWRAPRAWCCPGSRRRLSRRRRRRLGRDGPRS